MESIIRDIKLAKSGHEKISWVDHYMPTLNAIGDKLKEAQTFKGSMRQCSFGSENSLFSRSHSSCRR